MSKPSISKRKLVNVIGFGCIGEVGRVCDDADVMAVYTHWHIKIWFWHWLVLVNLYRKEAKYGPDDPKHA